MVGEIMKTNRKNNCLKVLAHLKKHGWITRKWTNVPRLAARIHDIRNKMNIPIDSTMHYGVNEKWAVYTLGVKK